MQTEMLKRKVPSGFVAPGKLGEFDVDAEGHLSLDGQTRWPVYAMDGGLSTRTVSYRVVGDEIIQTFTPLGALLDFDA
jgi:hypothetical protein